MARLQAQNDALLQERVELYMKMQSLENQLSVCGPAPLGPAAPSPRCDRRCDRACDPCCDPAPRVGPVSAAAAAPVCGLGQVATSDKENLDKELMSLVAQLV